MKKQVTLKIPQTWGEVKLGSYQNYVGTSESKEPNDVIYNTISAFCDVPTEVVERFKLEDLKKVYNSLNKLIEVELNKSIINKIELDGVTYGMHPNLDSMTFGEYVDIEEFSKEKIQGFHKVLAVLYRPIIKEKNGKYNIEPYETKHQDQAEKFKAVNMDVVNGLTVFFYRLGGECLQTFQASIVAEAETEKVAKLPDLTGGLA
jgi:hypothetical protein